MKLTHDFLMFIAPMILKLIINFAASDVRPFCQSCLCFIYFNEFKILGSNLARCPLLLSSLFNKVVNINLNKKERSKFNCIIIRNTKQI